MKGMRIVKRNQAGAVLTLEYVILMIGGAAGAIALFIILGGKLPIIYDAWLNQVTFDASATFQGIETAACNQIINNSISIMSPVGYLNFMPSNPQVFTVDPTANPLCMNNGNVWTNNFQ